MARQEIWFGSNGPFIFDDADKYPDGETMRGFRASQILIEDEPSNDNEVARQQTVSSQAELDQRYSLMLS